VLHYDEGDVVVHRTAWQIAVDPEAEHPELVLMLEEAG
jgi:hypothetical protein